MSENLQGVDVAVEHPHHSGIFAEALEVSVRDYGNNELWTGTAADFAAGKAPKYRIPTRLVATKLGRLKDCYSELTAAYYLAPGDEPAFTNLPQDARPRTAAESERMRRQNNDLGPIS